LIEPLLVFLNYFLALFKLQVTLTLQVILQQ